MSAKLVSTLSLIAVVAFIGIMVATPALAQFVPVNSAGSNTASGNEMDLIQHVTNWVLGITGAVAVLFIIYGGFRYITASGNQTQMEAAKNILIKAIIGLVIVLVAYVIVTAVLSALT